jgi:predicted acetyltransferase
LVATSDRAEIEMLRFLVSVDWVTRVNVSLRPLDDVAPLTLTDGRVATLSHRSDHVWARLVDVPAALAARRYAVDGSLVFEVADGMGLTGGRFALEGGPDGATCAPTDAPPDLAVPVAALGAAYLGGQSWARLAAAGWLDEDTNGAVARAGAMFASPRAPWCALTF